MKKNRILIAGGTGFIGYHLAKRCLKLNWKVVSISTKPPKKKRKLKNVNYLILDISNQKKIFEKLSTNYDYVVNLAGYVDHTHNVKTMKSHFDGCKNLSLFFLNSKIKKFVQVGSSIEYGKIKSPQIENKNNIQKTYSVYGKAKLLSTKFLLKLSKEHSFPSVIIRPMAITKKPIHASFPNFSLRNTDDKPTAIGGIKSVTSMRLAAPAR